MWAMAGFLTGAWLTALAFARTDDCWGNDNCDAKDDEQALLQRTHQTILQHKSGQTCTALRRRSTATTAGTAARTSATSRATPSAMWAEAAAAPRFPPPRVPLETRSAAALRQRSTATTAGTAARTSATSRATPSVMWGEAAAAPPEAFLGCQEGFLAAFLVAHLVAFLTGSTTVASFCQTIGTEVTESRSL
ncbi:unnamed protein product [Prorocentrum cordatum]|uniref:Uncharacterized protein n=1 Tax=Prorocentrum cordatum TaxID=2364126 RepID=A0ABN9WPM9_9DINO|nr:unnamed protein product [Polarella glacialis]